MNPKSGKAGKAVKPSEPVEVFAADQADPGKVAEAKKREREGKTGKYGSVSVKPFKPSAGGSSSQSGGGGPTSEEEEEEVSWIEIEMVDEEDEPVVGLPYEITVPDGTVATGSLDEKGFARVEGFAPGECRIKFPTIDRETWKDA